MRKKTGVLLGVCVVFAAGILTAPPSATSPPAPTVTYTGLGNTLTVTVNNAPASLRVTHANNTITITDRVGTFSRTFNDQGFLTIKFVGGSAADVFDAQGLDLKVQAYGGGGADRIVGGDRADQLHGGSGDDVLLGGPGKDWLNGDSHADELRGGGDDDVLITIDGAHADRILDSTGRDSFWFDRNGASTDQIFGAAANDAVHAVDRFANSADRSLNGDRIADPALPSSPTDRAAPVGAYYSPSPDRPLFASSVPAATDVNQGRINDCKTVSALAAVARNANWALRSSMVDFGDRTYGMRLGSKFFRVDDDLVMLPGGVLAQAGPGAQSSIWPAIAEKAVAFSMYPNPALARYWVLTSTSSTVTFDGLGSATSGTPRIGEYASSQADLGVKLGNAVVAKRPVTLSLTRRVGTVNGTHAYTLWAVNRTQAGAVVSVVLRNPWGADGSVNGYNDGVNDGLVTLSLATIWSDRIPDANNATGRVNWGSTIVGG